VKLKKLRLKNFKGLRDYTLTPGGEDLEVYGQNASGKTTLFDSFCWLLFGKDSLNRSDFDLKFIHPDGTVEHNLEHEVTAVLDLDGEEITLAKRLTEKWTRKRRAAAKEFTGHETQHFIDGVPVNQRDYQARIAQIAPEETFRLLTNPRHFSEHLKWQDRRRILLDVCGDLSDADVIGNSDGLEKLPDILGKRTLDEHRKVIAARKVEVNRELQDIPVRISELTGTLPAEGADPKTVKSVLAQLRSQRAEKEAERTRIQTGGETAKLQKELAEVEAKLIKVENRRRLAIEDLLAGKRREKQELIAKNDELQRKAQGNDRTIVSNKAAITMGEKEIAALRDEWVKVDAEQFAFEPTCTCPTCGQALPEAQVEAAREKALADFNESKSKRLSKISADGKAFKAELERLAAENAKLEAESKALFEQAQPITERLRRLRTLEAEIQAALLNPPPTAPDEEEIALTNRQTEIEQALSELEIGNHDAVVEAIAALDELDASIREREAEYARITTAESTRARIDQLKRQEKDLSAEYERLEYEQNLTDRFVTAKVSMLEEKINSRFKLARFQLFEQQINGGIAECCEVTVNGVPYSSMNNAARINAGLDIIQTLSEHYGITAPIFVDNAESVNDLYRTTSQQIRLYVSDDETLTIKESTNDRQAA